MVDDNSLGLKARKIVLEELSHRVTTVATAEQALQTAASTKFDLIVSDYKLPGMTGSDLIRALRQEGKTVPVILLSGYVEALGLNEENTGADIVLQKSANEVAHLVRAVKGILQRPAPRKQAASYRPTLVKKRKKA
jgi:CheY-like chemotaxis protein